MRRLPFALLFLLGALLSFHVGLGSPLFDDDVRGVEARAERGSREGRPSRGARRGAGRENEPNPTTKTCVPVTNTRTVTDRSRRTFTTAFTHFCPPTPTPTTTDTDSSTTRTYESSSTSIVPTRCNACGNECPSPAAVTVTKTLDWEDIDGTAASRVPIPFNYHGFSHYNPDQNKVYRSGPPPVSVGNGRQVAYANDGKFGLGALGFVIVLKSFWIMTFLDPANGLTSATVRVSGPLVGVFTQKITADRQFVQIVAPTTQSNTAVGFFIEVFKGDTVGGERLPAWIDDIVYERNLWPATCCQNSGTYSTLNFNDINPANPIPSPYQGFQLQGGWQPTHLAGYDNQGTVLYHPPSSQPGSIRNPTTPFTLTRLRVFIPQGTDPGLGQNKQTAITLNGYDGAGNERTFGWSVPAVTFQPGPVMIDLGGDWTVEGNSPTTGFFAAAPENGFRGIQELRIKVEEMDFSAGGAGKVTPMEFWIDDLQYQITC